MLHRDGLFFINSVLLHAGVIDEALYRRMEAAIAACRLGQTGTQENTSFDLHS